MVTLSAHNKHSPTTRAVLSPTLEQQFDSTKMKYSDEIKSISTAINKDIENVETSTKKNCAKAISQTNLNSTCVKEVNVMQKTLTENENNSNDFSKQISTRKEMFKLHKLIPKTADIPQNFTAYVGTLAEKNENEESDKEVINKSFEIEHIPKSQTLPRMFRGDLHDSGISDCGSSLMTPSVHVEPGIVSTIKEEIDHEGPNRESKQILKNEDNRRSSTAEILVNLVQSKKTFPYDTEIIADGDKVATKHNVTKASFETNPVQKVINKNTDARILIKHNHDKFRPTGNVSRTAKIFERKNKTLNSNNSQVSMTQCTYSAAIITEKPPNERIQKAFAFWKK